MKPFTLGIVYLALLVLFPSTSSAGNILTTKKSLHGSRVSYLVELAKGGKLILDANNGFFDKQSFRAEGKHAVPQSDEDLISSHFTHLVASSRESAGEARWHIWCPNTGPIHVELYFNVPGEEAGKKWQLEFGDQQSVVRANTSGAGLPQKSRVEFSIKVPGKHTLSLRSIDHGSTNTEIHSIYLTGNSIETASLLRARWRPAAIHTQYHSSTCPTTTMWVFESQSDADVPSYSPMTTRFGYYGASFAADRRAAGNMNFSMWAAGRKAKSAPPLDQMPHLLATGNPEAEFSGFGHEGSGVKIRNWEPLSHHPRSIIQALRVETADGYDTYSGYFFDERVDRWVLYAIGRKPVETRRGQRRGNEPTTLRPASFCEIPGPPAAERTGDRLRQIRRRGWFYGNDKRWHSVDRQTTKVRPSDPPTNKFIKAADGWFMMATGGMEMFEGTTEVHLEQPSQDFPAYLGPKYTAQLFELPVEFGPSRATQVSRNDAVINYELKQSGPNAKATLCYGPADCLTFIQRELHGTERKGVSRSILSKDRVWASATEPQAVRNGKNEFRLKNLKPWTMYYYRLYVINKAGKSWDFKSGTFTTR